MAINFLKSKYSQLHKKFRAKKPCEYKFFTLLDGSVRSGKTVILIIKLVHYLYYMGDKGTVLLSGYSKNTVYNNVLNELFNYIENFLGGKYSYNRATGDLKLWLFGNQYNLLVCGAGKSDSENAIRGLTLAGWFADELTLHHKTFFHQALNRLSIQDAKVFASTNPDSPNHWLYQDYISPYNDKKHKEHKRISKIFELWHFVLKDNANIPAEYIETISNSYHGAFYLRMIEGQWVVSDGLVYECFRPEVNIIPHSQILQKVKNKEFAEYIVGVDWGFDHPMTASIIGVTIKFEYYQVCEFYEKGKQPEDVISWLRNKEKELDIYLDKVYPDSARADSCDKLRFAGFRINNKPQKVAPSIDTVRSVIQDQRYFISDTCTNTINEFATYRYPTDDEKLKKHYEEDLPLKQDDDCMDGCVRYPIHGYEMKYNRNRLAA